jgi:hypothetical protein
MQNASEVDAVVKSGGKVATPPVAKTRGVTVTVAPEMPELLDGEIPDPAKIDPKDTSAVVLSCNYNRDICYQLLD